MKRFAFKAFFISGAAVLAGSGYMLFEAGWLKLGRKSLEIPHLSPALDGLKLLHISDIHAGSPGPGNRAISKITAKAREAEPDIIFFTGDMTDKKKDITPYLELLSSVKAPLGKFAVLGNHDHGLRKTVLGNLSKRLTGKELNVKHSQAAVEEIRGTVLRNRDLLKNAGISLLENECVGLKVSRQNIQVCGIDDYQYGCADMPKIEGQLDPDAGFRVLLSHSPDIVDVIPNGDYQLVLSGHTHGGQICIPHPTKGKILLSTSGSKFGSGIYSLPNLTMHVSPGVGTTLLPFRLLSRPEITLLTLRSKLPSSLS